MKTIIDEYFTAICAMDAEAWVSTFAEDAVTYEPVGGSIFQGHRAIWDFFEGIVAMFDSIELIPEFTHIAGNEIAVKWQGKGVSKNGNRVTFEGIDLFELNSEGKIQTLKGYWNPEAMMAQL